VNVRSLVCVPLRAGGAAMGVLVACFDDAEAADSDDLGMLQAYADQAALVIVRAQAYEQQRAASEQLHEADRMKSEFLATVSHELRTPLTAAKGFVDTVLLHWDRLSEVQRREMLTRASRNADLLTQQIDLLLDLSRMDSGRLEMIFEDVEIGDLVRETVSALAPVVAERAVRITVPEHLHARVDHAAFVHVLSNLLANAVKFSDPGGRIEIGARRQAGDVVVWVEDDGIGVDPAEQERIFERFYQVPSQDRGRGGTGIGLAVVARFVELQEGRVWVESEPGTGSRFSFTVPAVLDVTESEGAEEPPVYAE
jgi:signal transduction histidine kinase